ncbi:tetratricopeptide repeat protein [Roseivirga sp. BDSF3-8]|uniref:tetratricopeptide repeat protein n=1 Tax=Roseivirga sp. BDSF3-8 TaxID=3241598 RepID=UPI0035324529
METITAQHIELLIEQERYDLAEKHTRDKLSVEPESEYYQTLLCLILINTSRAKEGLEVAIGLLARDAGEANYHYLAGRAYLSLDKAKKAFEHAQESIKINPFDAEHFALACSTLFVQKKYKEALGYAEKGLTLNPENLSCLNLRTQSLVKLNRKEAAFETLDSALEKDPENAFTHSNYGWSHLEKGSHKKAMTHFQEALRLDPNNEWAQGGMMEALKSRYFIYRLFLKYVFWISKLSKGQRIGVFVGLYAVIKFSAIVGERTPSLQVAAHVLVGLYLLFILSTWVIGQIFNFSLLFHPQGKYLVDKNDRISAIITSSCLIGGIILGTGFLLAGSDQYSNIYIFFIFSALGIGSMMDVENKTKRILAIVISVFIFLVGAVGITMLLSGNKSGAILFMGFFWMSILYTWVKGLILN